MDTRVRCAWCEGDSLYRYYHDNEWGVPCRDDKKLFEFLILEGAQAGLSWLTILRKRENYRSAFANFEAEKVAVFTEHTIQRLMQDSGIVRNRLKLESAVSNARFFCSCSISLAAPAIIFGVIPMVSRWLMTGRLKPRFQFLHHCRIASVGI